MVFLSFAISFLFIGSSVAFGAVENIKSMVHLEDGRFLVSCQDNTESTHTAEEIRENVPCGGPSFPRELVKSNWTLTGHWSHWNCEKLYQTARADENQSGIADLTLKCLEMGLEPPLRIEAVVKNSCDLDNDYYQLSYTYVARCQGTN